MQLSVLWGASVHLGYVTHPRINKRTTSEHMTGILIMDTLSDHHGTKHYWHVLSVFAPANIHLLTAILANILFLVAPLCPDVWRRTWYLARNTVPIHKWTRHTSHLGTTVVRKALWDAGNCPFLLSLSITEVCHTTKISCITSYLSIIDNFCYGFRHMLLCILDYSMLQEIS